MSATVALSSLHHSSSSSSQTTKKNDEFANRFFCDSNTSICNFEKKNENESEMKNFFFIEILPFIFLKKIHSFIYSLLDIKYRNIA